LKLNAPSHVEAHHEADALAFWAGAGAAQLVARDDARRALLIERCRPGTRLRDARADEPAVVSMLLPRLWGDPDETHPFKLLAEEAARWANVVSGRYENAGAPFERIMLDYAARRLPQCRPEGRVARQPGLARRQRPSGRARAIGLSSTRNRSSGNGRRRASRRSAK
jgi:streptomycin 6-kinase